MTRSRKLAVLVLLALALVSGMCGRSWMRRTSNAGFQVHLEQRGSRGEPVSWEDLVPVRPAGLSNGADTIREVAAWALKHLPKTTAAGDDGWWVERSHDDLPGDERSQTVRTARTAVERLEPLADADFVQFANHEVPYSWTEADETAFGRVARLLVIDAEQCLADSGAEPTDAIELLLKLAALWDHPPEDHAVGIAIDLRIAALELARRRLQADFDLPERLRRVASDSLEPRVGRRLSKRGVRATCVWFAGPYQQYLESGWKSAGGDPESMGFLGRWSRDQVLDIMDAADRLVVLSSHDDRSYAAAIFRELEPGVLRRLTPLHEGARRYWTWMYSRSLVLDAHVELLRAALAARACRDSLDRWPRDSGELAEYVDGPPPRSPFTGVVLSLEEEPSGTLVIQCDTGDIPEYSSVGTASPLLAASTLRIALPAPPRSE